jgi:hypothetical protein
MKTKETDKGKTSSFCCISIEGLKSPQTFSASSRSGLMNQYKFGKIISWVEE